MRISAVRLKTNDLASSFNYVESVNMYGGCVG